jgi:hypothetical protein
MVRNTLQIVLTVCGYDAADGPVARHLGVRVG